MKTVSEVYLKHICSLDSVFRELAVLDDNCTILLYSLIYLSGDEVGVGGNHLMGHVDMAACLQA